jgi:hypothetical protein
MFVRYDLKNPKPVVVKEQYKFKISNRYAALENSGVSGGKNRAS